MKEDTVHAGEGGVVVLKVYVTGNPTPDVYWRKGRSDDIDTRQGKYIIVDDSSLTVLKLKQAFLNIISIVITKYQGSSYFGILSYL